MEKTILPAMIERLALLSDIRRALGRSRAVMLAGPRQAGKTTLARQFLGSDSAHYFDLENPLDLRRLDQPMATLSQLSGLVVIDEVQRLPGLFPQLRVLIDRLDTPGQYLLLGSASPVMLRQAGESLLGRVEVIEVGGIDLAEALAPPPMPALAPTPAPAPARGTSGAASPQGQGHRKSLIDRLWLRGGFARSLLAANDQDSMAWRQQAITSHVELDLPQFGVNVAPPAMLRFWRMLAHCHGQVWNAADPARSLGISEPTTRRYLDTLTQTLMVRQLQPWHANLGKRQVKSPKIYFRDTGLLHTLMDLTTLPELLTHPRSGASWEGFALEQVLRVARPDAAYFWATQQGAELDLLMLKGQQKVGVEFKRADAPQLTKSMHIAMADLALDKLYVVYPGEHRFNLGPRVEAVPLWALLPHGG
jgi:uncharacterized protein